MTGAAAAKTARILGAVLGIAQLAGCVPAPRAPLATQRRTVPAFTTVRAALTHAGLHPGRWPATHWWRIFHDRELSQLIHQGLAASGNLKAALAHVRAARAAYRLAASANGLSIAATGSIQRERASATGLIPPPFAGHVFNYGTLGLNARTDLAFWDRQHAAVKAALGEVAARQAQAALLRLIVSTEIAERYWDFALAQSRVRTAQAVYRVRARMAGLLRARYRAGVASAIQAQDARGALDQARMRLRAAKTILLRTRFALAALMGRGPRFAYQLLAPSPSRLPALDFPRRIGIDLLARRPDIEVRYWEVKMAAAGREEARARYYPDVSLDGALAYQSINLGTLVDPTNIAAAIGPAINLPLFGSGARRARLSRSRARFDMAVDRYNATIIAAVNQVAYALLALAGARQEWREAEAQTRHAQHAFFLVKTRLQAGIVGTLSERRARLLLLAARQTEEESRVRVLKALVAVIKNLGGGYHALNHGRA